MRTLSPSTCQDCVPGRAVESSVQGSEPGGRHGPRCEPSLCVVPAHAVRRSCLTSRVQTRPPTHPGPQVTFLLQRVAALARSGGEVWLWHWAKLAANLQFSTCPIRLTNPARRAPLKIRQGARHAQTTSHTPRGSAGRAQRAPVRARAGDGGGGAAPHTGERAAPWHQGRPSRKPALPGPPWREPRPAGYGLRPPRRMPSLLRRPSQVRVVTCASDPPALTQRSLRVPPRVRLVRQSGFAVQLRGRGFIRKALTRTARWQRCAGQDDREVRGPHVLSRCAALPRPPRAHQPGTPRAPALRVFMEASLCSHDPVNHRPLALDPPPAPLPALPVSGGD